MPRREPPWQGWGSHPWRLRQQPADPRHHVGLFAFGPHRSSADRGIPRKVPALAVLPFVTDCPGAAAANAPRWETFGRRRCLTVGGMPDAGRERHGVRYAVLPASGCQMSMTEAKSTSPAGNRRAPPAAMTIFGAAGDLTKRLVVPALYNLVRAGRLPDEFSIVGVDHNPFTTETWRQSLSDEVRNWRERAEASSSRRRSIAALWTGLQAACAISGAIISIPRPTASSPRC